MGQIRTGRSFACYKTLSGTKSFFFRYIFLLFKEPEGFKNQKEVTPETSRANFNVSIFVDKVGLGDAVAGTFMWVGPDN